MGTALQSIRYGKSVTLRDHLIERTRKDVEAAQADADVKEYRRGASNTCKSLVQALFQLRFSLFCPDCPNHFRSEFGSLLSLREIHEHCRRPEATMPAEIFRIQVSPRATWTHLSDGITKICRHREGPDPQPVASTPAADRIDISSLWSGLESSWTSNICQSCIGLVGLLQNWMNRDSEGCDPRGIQGMITLYHEDENGILGLPTYTLADVAVSAMKGCRICSLAVGCSIKRGLPFNMVDWVKDRNWTSRAEVAIWDCYKLFPEHDDPGERLCALAFGEDFVLDDEDPNPGVWTNIEMLRVDEWQRLDSRNQVNIQGSVLPEIPKSPICLSTGHPEALNLASWWLLRCLKEHRRCKILASPENVVANLEGPTRLLYVGTLEEPELKLYINRGSRVSHYFCLSYCWGKVEHTRLTNSNMSDFLDKIDINVLPTTIRDAIQVTRFLGSKYLWVDALCIIQDSKEDWSTESAKMGTVYRNSILTVAALGAKDCSEGLFSNRNPFYFRNFEVPGTDFVLCNSLSGCKLEFDSAAPLQRRGWVVQEYLSAPRTLFFGCGGIYWQCMSCEAHESDTLGAWSTEKNPKLTLNKILVSNAETSESSEAEFWPAWKKILERYTDCDLSFQTDKLVAISGIVGLLQNRTQGKYVVGLWLDHLLPGLLWSSYHDTWRTNIRLQRLNIGIPSFSWASVSQPINVFGASTGVELSLQPGISLSLNSNEVPSQTISSGITYIHTLSLVTQLKKVLLLPRNLKTSARPRLAIGVDSIADLQDRSDWENVDPANNADDVISPSFHIMCSRVNDEDVIHRQPLTEGKLQDTRISETLKATSTGPYTYDWSPDIVLDGSIKEAWVACLAQYKMIGTGAAGLIVIPIDEARQQWTRIGVVKYATERSGRNLRYTIVDQHNEVLEKETAKYNSPNPFMVDPAGSFVTITLV